MAAIETEITIPLKYLSNFWRSVEMSFINYEVEFGLSWKKDCVLMEHHSNINGVNFMITSIKRYIPVVTLSTNDNIKFLENKKQGFKTTIYWIKYRSKVKTQPKNNSLDYLIDPTLRNINKKFIQLFKVGANDPTRNSFLKYYMLLVQIKDFNALIGNKPFFDQPLNKN